MDESKLYYALLKSQEDEERRQQSQKNGKVPPEDGFRKERPYADSVMEGPNWVTIETEEEQFPPTVFDASISLGLIENPRPWTRDQLRARKIVYPGMPNKAILDAFREIRIQLRNRAGEKNFTVMYSSLGGRESSVLTAYNLAASFALDSHTSALFIDCDPYGQQLPDLVSSAMAFGVTDFVSDKAVKVRNIIYPSGIDRLSVIPAGTQGTSAVELFSSVRMKELMIELRGRYPDRCIVIHAPPFRENTEARILTRYADQVVLGVPFGQVTGEVIMDCVEALGSDNFSGLIFQE